jgi:hypothetical protein
VGGKKRKRGTFTEDEKLLLTNMLDAVNNVANALRETGPAHVDGNLYLAVMETLVLVKRNSYVPTPTCWTTKPRAGALLACLTTIGQSGLGPS